jgi:hypothetical protein
MPPIPEARARARVNACVAMNLVAGDDVEGERQQRVSGEDRGCVVERLVRGGPAAAQIGIVHRREVVMDQRVAMDAFQRRAGEQRRAGGNAEQGRALHHQKRPQALAAVQAAVTHGVKQPLRPFDLVFERLVGEQFEQQCFRRGRGGLEALNEGLCSDGVHVNPL